MNDQISRMRQDPFYRILASCLIDLVCHVESKGARTPELFRKRLLSGMYGRVAARLALEGDGQSRVARVAAGRQRDERIELCLGFETDRIEHAVETYREKYIQIVDGGAQ